MHAFCGDHLVIFDAFGLTRVTLPDQVKHNKKVHGRFLVQNGPLLVGHSDTSNRRFAMTVPELRVVPIEKRWNYNLTYGFAVAVTPAGLPCEALGAELVVYGLDGKQQSRVKATRSKALAGVDLGPELVAPTSRWSAAVAIGPDGTFVVLGDGGLAGGKLVEGKTPAITDAWTAAAVRPQGRVHVRAGTFGAFVSVFHPALGRAICIHVARGKLARDTVACIAPVDFDGANIVYQPSTTEVCRKPLGGAELERFSLPRSAAGIGAVMADGQRLLFLTPDHERIYDVITDDVIVRGLPDGERAARTKLLAFVETFRPAANAANLDLGLAALCPPAYGVGPRPQWHWDDGDQSVLRSCVIGNLIDQAYRDPDLSAGSYSLPTSFAPITEPAMRRMFDVVDEQRLDLLAGVAMFESALESHWRHGGSKPRKPLFDKRAARMLLWALVESLAAPDRNEQPRLAANAEPWAARPLTAATLIARIDPVRPWSRGDGRRSSSCQSAAAWVVLDYLEADALAVFLDWFLERPSAIVEANTHRAGRPTAMLAMCYPGTKQPLFDALAAAVAGGNAKRAARATSLQSAVTFEIR